jgi:hypothetical protein
MLDQIKFFFFFFLIFLMDSPTASFHEDYTQCTEDNIHNVPSYCLSLP